MLKLIHLPEYINIQILMMMMLLLMSDDNDSVDKAAVMLNIHLFVE